VAPGKKQTDQQPEISGTEGATAKSMPRRLATILSADDWLVVGSPLPTPHSRKISEFCPCSRLLYFSALLAKVIFDFRNDESARLAI
jgi:hypothetical protein